MLLKNKILKSMAITLGVSVFCLNFSWADCARSDIQITGITPSVINFNSDLTQTVNINITHGPFVDTRTCVYAVVMDYGRGTNYVDRRMANFMSDILMFNVHKALPATGANVIRNQQDVTSNSQVLITPYFSPLPTSQSHTQSFVAMVPSVPLNLNPGTYLESLVVKVVARPTSDTSSGIISWPTVAESAISFVYIKPAILEISIVDSGQPINNMDKSQLMSFGKLASGLTQTADVMIDTNVGYRLFVSSLNQGELAHQVSADRIPYVLNFDGSDINLAGSNTVPVNLINNPDPSPAGGYRHPVSVTIGPMTQSEQAGVYSDSVIFRVEAF